MNVIDLEILIPASPEFIWRFLGDIAALPLWQEDVSSVSFLSTQREGPGTRWRASSDDNSDIVVEVSAWYDTLGYEYCVRDGTSFADNQGRIRLNEVTDGTLIRWTFQYELKGVLGGLRNAMRIKRGTSNQIQASLRSLHQLILQESGGISTHEAKASVREAPAVDERLTYTSRHPTALQEPALAELSAGGSEQDTDKLAPFLDFAATAAPVPTVRETDTKPNPVVLAPGFGLEIEAEAESVLDDTRPVELEALIAEPISAAGEPTAPIAPGVTGEARQVAPPVRPPPAVKESHDSSELSVFEIFGLQKPSQARNEAVRSLAVYRSVDRPADAVADASASARRRADETEHLPASRPTDEAAAETITGLRRRVRRRRTSLRSHS